jgi:hypothetical protein
MGPRAPKAACEPRLKEPTVWTLPAAHREVHARSGGRCELGAPGCQRIAREVDHTYGRRVADPHDPAKLLHLCGHGNTDGCHGLVSSSRRWREWSRVIAANLQAHWAGS